MSWAMYAAKRGLRELQDGMSLRRRVFVEIAIAATVLAVGSVIVVAVLYRAGFVPFQGASRRDRHTYRPARTTAAPPKSATKGMADASEATA